MILASAISLLRTLKKGSLIPSAFLQGDGLICFILLAWPLYLNDLWLQYLTDWSLLAVWIGDVLFYTIVPVFTAILLLRSRRLSLADLGLNSRISPTALVIGIILCPLYSYLYDGILWGFVSDLKWGAIHSGYTFPAEEPGRSLTIVYASLSVGIIEETLFRGFLTQKLSRSINSQMTILLVSSFLFSLIHWGSGIGSLLYTFLWAIPVTAWYMRTRDIWTLIAFHAFYDFIVFNGWI